MSQTTLESLEYSTSNNVQAKFQLVPLDAIKRGDNPRQLFDREQIDALAESIKKDGLISPVTLRRIANGEAFYYEIVAGERRKLACDKLGWDTIPAIVRDMDEIKAAEIALIENLQRVDLNPMEEAAGYQKLAGYYTQEQIAQKVGRDQSTIANALRLLSLPSHLQERASEGSLSKSHWIELCALSDQPVECDHFARKAFTENLSVKALREQITEFLKAREAEQNPPLFEEKAPTAQTAPAAHSAQHPDVFGKEEVTAPPTNASDPLPSSQGGTSAAQTSEATATAHQPTTAAATTSAPAESPKKAPIPAEVVPAASEALDQKMVQMFVPEPDYEFLMENNFTAIEAISYLRQFLSLVKFGEETIDECIARLSECNQP